MMSATSGVPLESAALARCWLLWARVPAATDHASCRPADLAQRRRSRGEVTLAKVSSSDVMTSITVVRLLARADSSAG